VQTRKALERKLIIKSEGKRLSSGREKGQFSPDDRPQSEPDLQRREGGKKEGRKILILNPGGKKTVRVKKGRGK